MRPFLMILLISLLTTARAQYYYKDIIGSSETTAQMKAYLANGVKKVALTSFDADGTKNEDFSVQQEFDPAKGVLTTITKSNQNEESFLYSYVNAKGQVSRTMDSTQIMVGTTTYTYNSAGQLENVLSVSTDSSKRVSQKEEHRWEYSNGKISRMLRIKNDFDTTYVGFKTDEAGNVSEETSKHKGAVVDDVYYYYDGQNRLTDIVRYNARVKRLLPEYMFEYDAANRVIQKLTIPPSKAANYLIWRYQYDQRGLKVKEAVYDHTKKLNGKVEYNYSAG